MAYLNFVAVFLALQVVIFTRIDAASVGQLTTSGDRCVFPFTYKGVVYKSCTTTNHYRLWCSTTAKYEGKWGNCEESCVFPFKYNNVSYSSCTSKDHDRPWCSTTSEYQGKWKNCKGSCVFPFSYQNVSYNSCTSKNHHRPWCSTTSKYQGQWKNCADFTASGYNTVAGDSCSIPFTYKGKVYHSCTTALHNRPWCSITTEYEKDKKWGNCADFEPSDLQTDERLTCAFPFIYNGQKYKSCITNGNRQPWCSATANYDKDLMRGNCSGFYSTNKYNTTEGQPCAFPFIYRGQHYNICTKKNHDRLWCSTTTNYDEDKKWGNCKV